MTYSKARRTRYMDYLRRHGVKEASTNSDNFQGPKEITLRFMPLPNATRWNSWFQMAIYVCDYLEFIRGFYCEEEKSKSNESIKNIMSIFNDRNMNGLVEIYLTFIRYHSRQFLLDTEFFQKERDPIFPLIEARIQQLDLYLGNGTTAVEFGNEVNEVLLKLNTNLSTFIPIFQAAYNSAYQKFCIHFLDHPSRPLFKATRIFDPRFLKLTLANCDIQKYGSIIFQLSNPSVELLQEWSLYCNLDLVEVDYSNLQIFWEKIQPTLPLLSAIAFDYIWLPISSSAVERSF